MLLEKEIILYGIRNINEKIDSITKAIKLENKQFEVKLITCEAITNAYIHGNGCDSQKPIMLKFTRENRMLNIKVKDCGKENKKIVISNEIHSNNILNDSGRGLFIISSYADEVEFNNGCINMKVII